jgi:hypothetical protein
MAMTTCEDVERCCGTIEPGEEPRSQFGACVLDMLDAREAFADAHEHLINAGDNLQYFIVNGEARDVTINGVEYRVSNVDDSVVITTRGN